ncbi:hypothetical protein D9M71_355400 [compost metagenome]
MAMLQAVEFQAADLLHHDVQSFLEDDGAGLGGPVVDGERLAAVADDHVVQSVAVAQ